MAEAQSATTTALPPPPPVPRIAWSKEQQAFVVVAATPTTDKESPRVAPSSSVPRRAASSQQLTWSSDDIEAALVQFAAAVTVADHRDESAGRPNDSLDAFIAARKALLERIHTAQASSPSLSPVRLLPLFLTHWQRGLERMELLDDGLSIVRVAQEFFQLAETAVTLGAMVQARAALGRCLQLARVDPELPAAQATARDAKRLLLQCVRYQNELQRWTTALHRRGTPTSLVYDAVERLTELQSLAPLAVDVMVLKVRALRTLQRTTQVVALLEAFAFTSASATLTLAYATALEGEGFYQRSISVATAFLREQETNTKDETASETPADRRPAQSNLEDYDLASAAETSAVVALTVHASQLRAVLAHKTKGDDALLASRYDAAACAFSDALSQVHPQSRRLRATLLLGRAHARIGLERLRSARSDLEESLGMDPSNTLARVRLRTVDLACETQQMQRRLVQQ